MRLLGLLTLLATLAVAGPRAGGDLRLRRLADQRGPRRRRARAVAHRLLGPERPAHVHGQDPASARHGHRDQRCERQLTRKPRITTRAALFARTAPSTARSPSRSAPRAACAPARGGRSPAPGPSRSPRAPCTAGCATRSPPATTRATSPRPVADQYGGKSAYHSPSDAERAPELALGLSSSSASSMFGVYSASIDGVRVWTSPGVGAHLARQRQLELVEHLERLRAHDHDDLRLHDRDLLDQPRDALGRRERGVGDRALHAQRAVDGERVDVEPLSDFISAVPARP